LEKWENGSGAIRGNKNWLRQERRSVTMNSPKQMSHHEERECSKRTCRKGKQGEELLPEKAEKKSAEFAGTTKGEHKSACPWKS